MKSHTELSKTPLPIPTVACKLHYWTSNEHQCQIPDDNISARSYHEKAPKKQEGGQKGQNIRHGQYYSVKQNFVTSSGGSWILPNKRPDHLRDSLKDMEETLKSQSVLHVRWIKRNRMQIILHTGLLINILLSDTYDIQKIVFDKSLIGKISQDGGAISSAFLSRQFCLLSFTDKNKLGFASFTQRPGTPDHKQVSNKISSMDMKISFHDIPGTPNRKSEKKFCVNKLEDKAVCWCPSYKGPNSWTPTSTDKERANMILLGCSFGRLEVLNYVQTECDPLSVDFSNLNPYQIHTLEKSVNVRKESFLHYTVYECLQNKIQRLNVSTLPLKSGLLSSARNKTEDKVVIGCTDGTLIVYNIITKAIVQVRESLVPSVVSWHPNGGIVMVASGSAELRCYDTSLSPLTTVLIGDLFSGMPGSSLKLSQFLTAGNGLVSLSWLDPSKDESSDNHGVVQQTKLNPAHDVALVLFDGGPLAILKLNLGVINKGLLRPLDIIKEYLSHRNVTPAIQVLNNINWNTDGHQAFHGLISIINHLLKLPLNHERENQLEGTLATFYAPSSPLSESVVVQYRHAISRYARKFFFHLLRFGRYEKSFLLAQDIQAQDLFVDLHFAAKEVGENRIARAAKERAYDLQSSGSSEGEDEDSYSDDDDHINMQARILQESRQDGGVRQSRKGARSQGDRSKDRRDKDKLKRTVPPSYPPPKMNNFMTALMNEARAVVQENSGAQGDEDQDDAAGKSSSSLKVMHLGYV